MHYNIDDYPAVRNHLLSFGKERLEQTGKKYIIDGVMVKARKKTSNKWFETQDSINFWNDFAKQKLVWTPVNSEYRFTILPENILINNSLFMIVGDNLKSLCGILNSSLYVFYLDILLAGGCYAYGSRDFFKDIPVIQTCNGDLEELVDGILNCDEKEYREYEAMINETVFEMYNLSENEKSYILSALKN